MGGAGGYEARYEVRCPPPPKGDGSNVSFDLTSSTELPNQAALHHSAFDSNDAHSTSQLLHKAAKADVQTQEHSFSAGG